MRIVILVGSQSGTAEMVGNEALAELRDRKLEVSLHNLAHVEPAVLSGDAVFLFITSSFGDGELPERARPFFERLKSERSDLSRLRYGIFGLGDNRSHAATFCHGPKKLDALLRDLGATRVGELECHDRWSKVHVDDHVIDWIDGWLRLVSK